MEQAGMHSSCATPEPRSGTFARSIIQLAPTTLSLPPAPSPSSVLTDQPAMATPSLSYVLNDQPAIAAPSPSSVLTDQRAMATLTDRSTEKQAANANLAADFAPRSLLLQT